MGSFQILLHMRDSFWLVLQDGCMAGEDNVWWLQWDHFKYFYICAIPFGWCCRMAALAGEDNVWWLQWDHFKYFYICAIPFGLCCRMAAWLVKTMCGGCSGIISNTSIYARFLLVGAAGWLHGW